jgi:hypothetical protein
MTPILFVSNPLCKTDEFGTQPVVVEGNWETHSGALPPFSESGYIGIK